MELVLIESCHCIFRLVHEVQRVGIHTIYMYMHVYVHAHVYCMYIHVHVHVYSMFLKAMGMSNIRRSTNTSLIPYQSYKYYIRSLTTTVLLPKVSLDVLLT